MSDFNSVDDQSWRDEPAEERDIALHCEDYPCCGHEAGDCFGRLYGSDASIKAAVYARFERGDDWDDES